MDIYIIDTNLLYSAFLNIDSQISQFIISAPAYGVSLYAPRYLEYEISKHRTKIQLYAGYSDAHFARIKQTLFGRVTFIDDDVIPFEEWVIALRLVRNIDPEDVNFVALANFSAETLWTGDRKLYEGLRAKGFERIVMFDEIKQRYGLS